jgi:hypothetical protein
MARGHENRTDGVDAEQVVNPPGPVRRQVNRFGFAALNAFCIFAISSFAAGKVNRFLGDVIAWPISQAAQ